MFSLRAARARHRADAPAAEAIKAYLRDRLCLDDDDILSISEIECRDPGCTDGVETVVLIMRAGKRTRAVKLPDPLASITSVDLERIVG